MRRALIIALATLVSLFAMPAVAQEAKRLINIDQSSFRPVQTGALSGVGIDKIGLDRSKRPCARIKMHVNRMTREEIDGLTVRPIGGMVELTKKSTSVEGNGLIFELTAKEQVRFYLHHDIYGDSNEVTVNLEGNKEYYLDAQLDQLFTITVASNMKDADVYIDNRYCNKTNEEYILIVHDITPGEHALRIEHAGRKAEQKILVHRDNVYFRCNVDTAEASPQYVVFEVEPANAMVFIDNEPQTTQEGYAQAVLQNGTYSWRVMAKGYYEQSGTFTVSGAKVTRKVTLKADGAMVTISAGGGADIWVNNERKGNSSWRGMLSSGTYIFEARKEGHRTTRLSQTITSATAEQSYMLDAPTPIMGRLDVSCVPAIADLYVDGKKIGETPLTTSLMVGEHSVELRRSGYTSQSQKVSVSEGKTATVNVTLAKVATTASTASTAATYADSATANFDGFEMVFVKGGRFKMGATAEQGKDAYKDEKPVHSVTVSDFYIGKYEVTQAQWEAVMGKNPSYFKGDNHPVENVSWNDVQKFIKKLNAKTGKRYRLPTEAEWEYAARGGDQSKGYKYSGSNDIGSVAWYTNNSGKQTHPVGQKQPNELGLYDMSGNVYEWCSDWYGRYSSGLQTNPTGPAKGSDRVLRGASWNILAWCCRVSDRSHISPSGRGSYYGFRLVCQP